MIDESNRVRQLTLHRLAPALIVVDILLVAAYIIDHAVGRPSRAFSEFTNLGGEANLPAWYSAAQLLIVAFVFTCCATQTGYEILARIFLWICAAVFVTLSLVEATYIHEDLGGVTDKLFLPDGDRKQSPFPRTGVWMFVFAAPSVLIACMMLAGLRYFAGSGAYFMKITIGSAIFLLSALGTEVLANWFKGGWHGVAQVASEEFGEMLGVTLILWGVIELLDRTANSRPTQSGFVPVAR